jgi:hypothetical protein
LFFGPTALRLGLDPSNEANAVTWNTAVDIPFWKSRYVSTVQYNMRQNDPFIKTSINGLIAPPVTLNESPVGSLNGQIDTLLWNHIREYDALLGHPPTQPRSRAGAARCSWPPPTQTIRPRSLPCPSNSSGNRRYWERSMAQRKLVATGFAVLIPLISRGHGQCSRRCRYRSRPSVVASASRARAGLQRVRRSISLPRFWLGFGSRLEPRLRYFRGRASHICSEHVSQLVWPLSNVGTLCCARACPIADH